MFPKEMLQTGMFGVLRLSLKTALYIHPSFGGGGGSGGGGMMYMNGWEGKTV